MATGDSSLILIVDDEEIGRLMLCRLLEAEGYRVECAENGSAGIEMARILEPDLILLDVVMPVIDGYEVCEILRRDPDLAEVPVIMLTSLDDPDSRLKGLDVGADDFLSKPVQPDELKARARTVTRLNRYRRLRTERARFGWVVENADDGYLLTDQNGQLLYANSQAKKILGLTQIHPTSDALRLIGRHFKLRPPELWSTWPKLPTETTLNLLRPESAQTPAVWLDVRVQNHGNETLLKLRDVTDERATRRCVWTFESLISHKLRTPLTKVQLGLSMITKKANRLTNEKIQEFADMAFDGTLELQHQLEGILGYLNTPTATPDGDGFPLAKLPDILDNITVQLGLPRSEPRFEGKLPNQLYLSSQAVELILFELFQNSKKFHPSKTPTIALSLKGFSDHVTIEIKDDGLCLTPEQLQRAAQPYYQGEKSFTGQVRGLGLGLSMVSAMVWEVGGDCLLRNREDSDGLVVELKLPTQ